MDAPVDPRPDVAFLAVCTGLVLFMTVPGLALFYGALGRSRDILGITLVSTSDRRRWTGDAASS
jgi:Amt family ammonium transporter